MDARGGRYLKYRPPTVAAPYTLFVAWRRPPAPLLAGALRHTRELMMVHPRLSHPFVQDPPFSDPATTATSVAPATATAAG